LKVYCCLWRNGQSGSGLIEWLQKRLIVQPEHRRQRNLPPKTPNWRHMPEPVIGLRRAWTRWA
jgi:hypothetical protein